MSDVQRRLSPAYDITEHRHRFAVWAAARATQRGFANLSVLRRALERSGVSAFLSNPECQNVSGDDFDKVHRRWCSNIIRFLNRAGIRNATYGRAAKLIAIYLKSVVVLGPDTDTQLSRVLHPPIDRILLRNLAKDSDSSAALRSLCATINWTQLDAKQYQLLIKELRKELGPNVPFWQVERHWTVTNDAEL